MHKKYTNKGDKKYGPYLYKTKRVNGKVITEYVGKAQQKTKKHRSLWIYALALLGLIFLIWAISPVDVSPTGRVSFDIQLSYELGEPILGDLKFNIKEGEFVPADSQLVIDYDNQSKTVPFSELILDTPESGSFYAEGSSVSGEGLGYGAKGSKIIYPELDFELIITSSDDVPDNVVVPIPIIGGGGTSSDDTDTTTDDSSQTEDSSEETNETEQTDDVDTNETTTEEPSSDTGSGTTSEDSNESEESSDSSEGSDSSEEDNPSESEDDSSSDDSTDSEGETESNDDSDSESSDESDSSSDSDNDSDDSSDDSSSDDSGSDDGDSDSGGDDSGSDGGGITGGVITETSYTVSGSVDRNMPFTYNLEPGQTAHLVRNSVSSNNQSLPDNTVSLNIQNNEVTIETNYFISEEGYGEEFLGDYALTLSVDLKNLDLRATPGTLVVELVHEGETIASQQESIFVDETKIFDETILNQTTNQTNETNETTILLITQTQDIPTIRIPSGDSRTLDLQNYFNGATRYEFVDDELTIEFKGQAVRISPNQGFTGARKGKIIAYNENDVLESNDFTVLISSGAVNIQTTRERIVVGEPVRWVKNVSLDTAGEAITVELPESANGVEISKIENGQEVPIDETSSNTTIAGGNPITGQVTIDLELERQPRFVLWLKKLVKGITGRVVDVSVDEAQNAEDSVEVVIDDDATEYVIEYVTEAPEAEEEETGSGKLVTISGPDDVEYTDVIASTTINNLLPISQAESIKVIWYNYDQALPAEEIKEVDEVEIEETVEEIDETVEIVEEDEIEDFDSLEADYGLDEESVVSSSPEETEDSSDSQSETQPTETETSEEVLEETTIVEQLAASLTGNAIDVGVVGTAQETTDGITIEELPEESVTEEHATQFEQSPDLSPSDNIQRPGFVKQQVPFDAYDLDFDGNVDYVEWVVPHLSNQTFEIIVIIKAEHLNETREFVSDIFDDVKELDGNWSEDIPENHYVRVTFEINLTNDRDITVYPRTITGTPSIIIYEVNGTDEIARFNTLTDYQYNKVYLTSLQGEQDTFDLHIQNGTLQFDHIIDPETIQDEFYEDCSDISDWTEQGGGWASSLGTCRQATQGSHNMTSIEIDLSGTVHSNVSYTWSSTLNSGDTLEIFASDNNGTNYSRLQLYSFLSNPTGGANISLDDVIKLTSTVRLRAECIIGGRSSGHCSWDDINVTSFTGLPQVTILNPLDQQLFGSGSLPILINVSLNEDGSLVEYTIDNGVNNFTMETTDNIDYNHSISLLTDGTYTLEVFANDTDNRRNDTETVSFVYDSTSPTLNFVSPTPANASSQPNTDIYVNVTSSDDNDHYLFTDFDNDVLQWFTMDNSSGSRVIDLSSHSTNGTLVNGAAINETGYFGDAAHFDGVDNFINISDLTFDNAGNFSLGAWFYLRDNSSAQPIFWKGDNGTTESITLFLRSTGVMQLSNDYGVTIQQGVGGINENQWYFVGITKNTTRYTLYLNGNQQGTDTTFSDPLSTTTDAYLGTNYFVNHLNGSIDDYFFFNRTLTSEEMDLLYNASSADYANNFTSLSTGTHTVTSHSVDVLNNQAATSTREITVQDTTPPLVTIISPENSTHTLNDITEKGGIIFNITANEGLLANYSLHQYPLANYNAINYTMGQVAGPTPVFVDTNTSIADGIYLVTFYLWDSDDNVNDTETVVFSVLNNGISNCTTISTGNAQYTVENNILTTVAPCLTVTADNVTINGQGNTLSGLGAATTSHGVAAGNTSNLTIIDFSITGYANSINISGITVARPGGNVLLINSSVDSIDANARDSATGDGLDGGNITLVNSNVTNISAFGSGCSGICGGVETPGDGGHVLMRGDYINLTNAFVNLSGGSTAASDGAAGILSLNVTGGLEDVSAVYGDSIRLNYVNASAGEIIWSQKDLLLAFSADENLFSLSYNNATFAQPQFKNLNSSVTLYDNPGKTLVVPAIFTDGVVCENCTNLTALTASTVIFNATDSGRYTIAENDVAPTIAFVDPTPADTTTLATTDFYVNVSSNDLVDHYVFTDLNDDVVLWMRMDVVNSSGDPTDEGSANANGALEGDVFINESGYWGDSAWFDGADDASDDRIIVSSLSGTDTFDDAFTISVWVYARDFPDGTFSDIIGTETTTGSQQGWVLREETNGQTISFDPHNESAGFSAIRTDNNAVQTHTWNHIVVRYNQSEMTLFWNGVANDTQTLSSPGALNNTNSFYIGRVETATSRIWNGSIDEVIIFNRSLTSGEISALYNASTTQYQHNFTSLTDGNYTFTSYGVDAIALRNETESRTVTVNPTLVASCRDLDSANTVYTQSANIIPSRTGACINITATNVTFNGAGYWLANNTYDQSVIYSHQEDTSIIGTNISASSFNSYGIQLESANNSYIFNNTLYSTGFGLGILSSSDIIVENNTATNNGNFGAFEQSSNGTIFRGNILDNNGFYGVYSLASSNSTIHDNSVTSNSLHGIYVRQSPLTEVTNNTVTHNNGTGIYVFQNSPNVTVTGNNATNNSQYGLSFTTSADSAIASENILEDNTFGGLQLSSSNRGIFTANDINRNDGAGINIGGSSFNNTFIHMTLDLNNNSLEFSGPENTFENITITNSASYGILYGGTFSLHQNQYINVSVSGSTIYDLFINTTNTLNETNFIDSDIGSYNLGDAVFVDTTFRNSDHGEILFLGDIDGNGTNLSEDIRITFNSAIVETRNNAGLNTSANVTLYNMPGTFVNPSIFRNEQFCGNGCYNFTSLNAATVVFNVTGWTEYSIRDSCLSLPTCSEGNDCSITSACVLNNQLCTDGVCDFANFTINATMSLLHEDTGDSADLTMNLTGTTFFNAGNTIDFSGRNQSDGGDGGTINITTTGLFNRTNAIFEGIGGSSGGASIAGGNGGTLQYNYHGLIGQANSISLNVSGGASSFTPGSDGPSNIRVKDLSCPRDADINNDGLIDATERIIINIGYNDKSGEGIYSSSYDINCDNVLNVVDLAKAGLEYGRGS